MKEQLKKINDEIYYATESVVLLNRSTVEWLKERALSNPSKKARVCAHHSAEDKVHEMLIALQKGYYVRPHRHHDKSESYHIIEGCLDVILFDEAGNICQVVELGEQHSAKNFYYRLAEPLFHSLIIYSDMVVFHETTRGPFHQEDTEYAEWASAESSEQFEKEVLEQIKELKKLGKISER